MDRSLATRAVFALVAVIGVGCATPGVEPDKYYPSDWPAIVLGGDCQSLQRTYKNKGVLVDEKGERSAIWLTDLFGKRRAPQEVIDARVALRRFKYATVKIEPGTPHSRSPDPRWNIVLELSHGRPGVFSADSEPNAVLKLTPLSNDRALGIGGWCQNGTLFGFGSETLGVGYTGCGLASATDRSLVVKCVHRLAGVAVVVPVFISDHFWSRFEPE
jgi:hypothetical protein